MTDTNYKIITVGSSLVKVAQIIRGRLHEEIQRRCEFFSIDTQRTIEDLDPEKGVKGFLMGKQTRNGKGCGQLPQLGQEAYLESKDELTEFFGSFADTEGVIVISAPGRGGTGGGSVVNICAQIEEAGVKPIVCIFQPSEVAGECGTPQISHYLKVKDEMFRRKWRILELHQDWFYKNIEYAGLPIEKIRELVTQDIAITIAGLFQFWAGSGLLDPSDLEQQVLARAGHIKVAEAPVDLSEDSDPEEEVQKALAVIKANGLHVMDGSLDFAAALRKGNWTARHMKALGLGIKALAEQLDLENASDYRFKEDRVQGGDYSSTGSLTLLLATHVRVETDEQTPMATSHVAITAPDNSGPIIPAPVRLVEKTSPQRPSLVESRKTAAAKIKLSESEVLLAAELHSQVYKGSTDPKMFTLAMVVDQVSRALPLSEKILEQWGPEKFFRIVNYLRQEHKGATQYDFTWEEFLENRGKFATHGVVNLFRKNYDDHSDLLTDEQTNVEARKHVWVLYMFDVLRTQKPAFPIINIRTSSGRRVTVTPSATQAELVSYQQAVRGDEEAQKNLEIALCVQKVFQGLAIDVWQNYEAPKGGLRRLFSWRQAISVAASSLTK